MSDNQIDVSVIVAVRNGAATIAQCIESILAQTECNLELVIVDALSSDKTQAIIETYGDAVTTYIREADYGIYDALNKALSVARGEWCSFLGADDYYLEPTSVARLHRVAEGEGGRLVFVHGGICYVSKLWCYEVHPSPRDYRSHFYQGKMLPHQGILHHTQSLRAIGGFDPSLTILGDLDALMRLLAVGEVRRCDDTVAAMRMGGLSGSRHWLQARERWRILRKRVGFARTAYRTLRPLAFALLAPLVDTVTFSSRGAWQARRAKIFQQHNESMHNL